MKNKAFDLPPRERLQILEDVRQQVTLRRGGHDVGEKRKANARVFYTRSLLTAVWASPDKDSDLLIDSEI